tara:strand:+ start:1497 stop:1643 length:147 start_codon:yes stop_codon:yes gene_type:complete
MTEIEEIQDLINKCHLAIAFCKTREESLELERDMEALEGRLKELEKNE